MNLKDKVKEPIPLNNIPPKNEIIGMEKRSVVERVWGWGWVTVNEQHERVFRVMILFCILIVVMGTQTLYVLILQNCIPN